MILVLNMVLYDVQKEKKKKSKTYFGKMLYKCRP